MLATALLAACGTDGPPPPTHGRYTLELIGYATYAGRLMQLKLKSADGSTTLATYKGSISPEGIRTITFEEVLEEGVVYRVDYFIDLDRDGAYAPTSGMTFAEPSWRLMVTGKATGVDDLHTANSDWTDITPF